MGKESNLGPSEIIEKAVAFFGPMGLGLTVVDQSDCCARFEGSGGYVFADAAGLKETDGSKVSIEGREWDYHIKRFMGEI
jgi:hypothetical protein